ncbi:MAG: hypothetical protein FWC95_00020 [Defluviitaleaceae bacterium]|nr:hypothetical protein [Defluviitaleaceae bacterium]
MKAIIFSIVLVGLLALFATYTSMPVAAAPPERVTYTPFLRVIQHNEARIERGMRHIIIQFTFERTVPYVDLYNISITGFSFIGPGVNDPNIQFISIRHLGHLGYPDDTVRLEVVVDATHARPGVFGFAMNGWYAADEGDPFDINISFEHHIFVFIEDFAGLPPLLPEDGAGLMLQGGHVHVDRTFPTYSSILMTNISTAPITLTGIGFSTASPGINLSPILNEPVIIEPGETRAQTVRISAGSSAPVQGVQFGYVEVTANFLTGEGRRGIVTGYLTYSVQPISPNLPAVMPTQPPVATPAPSPIPTPTPVAPARLSLTTPTQYLTITPGETQTVTISIYNEGRFNARDLTFSTGMMFGWRNEMRPAAARTLHSGGTADFTVYINPLADGNIRSGEVSIPINYIFTDVNNVRQSGTLYIPAFVREAGNANAFPRLVISDFRITSINEEKFKVYASIRNLGNAPASDIIITVMRTEGSVSLLGSNTVIVPAIGSRGIVEAGFYFMVTNGAETGVFPIIFSARYLQVNEREDNVESTFFIPIERGRPAPRLIPQ